MLKPELCGGKCIGVASQQTHDAFAPSPSGGVSRFGHGRSRRRFAGRVVPAGIHPGIYISFGVANRATTVLEELRAAASAAQLFEKGGAKPGVSGALHRIESRIATIRQWG